MTDSNDTVFDIDQHVEASLDSVRVIFKRVQKIIHEMKPGETVPATKLAADIAPEYGLTGPALYPTLRFLFKDYPGVVITRGAKGGIKKL
jgi:hypothetical protein